MAISDTLGYLDQYLELSSIGNFYWITLNVIRSSCDSSGNNCVSITISSSLTFELWKISWYSSLKIDFTWWIQERKISSLSFLEEKCSKFVLSQMVEGLYCKLREVIRKESYATNCNFRVFRSWWRAKEPNIFTSAPSGSKLLNCLFIIMKSLLIKNFYHPLLIPIEDCISFTLLLIFFGKFMFGLDSSILWTVVFWRILLTCSTRVSFTIGSENPRWP